MVWKDTVILSGQCSSWPHCVQRGREGQTLRLSALHPIPLFSFHPSPEPRGWCHPHWGQVWCSLLSLCLRLQSLVQDPLGINNMSPDSQKQARVSSSTRWHIPYPPTLYIRLTCCTRPYEGVLSLGPATCKRPGLQHPHLLGCYPDKLSLGLFSQENLPSFCRAWR